MAVLSLSNAHLAYGHVALLDGAGFSLEAGERLGLIGRNGADLAMALLSAAARVLFRARRRTSSRRRSRSGS